MTEINSHEDFITATRGKETLLLLTAPAWCIPCRRFHPHWEAAKEKMPDIQFLEIDMGENPEQTSEHWAYELFDVRSVPTVLAVSNVGHPGTTHDTRIAARAVVPFMKDVEEWFASVRRI